MCVLGKTMTGGSLGIGLRSASYGSLQQQQLQNNNIGLSPLQITPTPPRKPPKMLTDRDKVLHCFFKFAGRKKAGMLFLCVASAVVLLLVLYVGKGEDANEGDRIQNMIIRDGLTMSRPGSSPKYVLSAGFNAFNKSVIMNVVEQPPPPPSPPSPVFAGYKLPPGHQCESFTLPPPPADKKRIGPRPCPVCYLPVEEAVALMPKYPSPSPVVNNLTYVHEENLSKTEFGGSEFGGYPSLAQRNESFDIRESMNVHCGFIKGSRPGRQTGFDIDDSDLFAMDQCHGVVVASAVFGNYDIIQQPKNISETAKENVCFFMFVDEETEASLKNSSELDRNKRIGLWRIVVVHNLPFNDPRRNGKVPKLLLHRIFPNARYSIWIDGKLELVVDPYQILERFLWRNNASFAISRHYRRFDTFTEAEANKVAAKYDNASIDFQIDFYRKEGLTPYSVAKLPFTSDVPEGCVIIKEHIPITNLFTCLWFNEVDRFTSRDQISFSTVRDKIVSKVNWSFNMFLDCERRNFVIQGYHRDVLKQRAPPFDVYPPPPPILKEPVQPPPDNSSVQQPPDALAVQPRPDTLLDSVITTPVKKTTTPRRRGKDRRRHRKVSAGSKDTSSI